MPKYTQTFSNYGKYRIRKRLFEDFAIKEFKPVDYTELIGKVILAGVVIIGVLFIFATDDSYMYGL